MCHAEFHWSNVLSIPQDLTSPNIELHLRSLSIQTLDRRIRSGFRHPHGTRTDTKAGAVSLCGTAPKWELVAGSLKFQKQLQATYDKYIAMRDELGRTEKPQTLMDMATIFGRYERANGRLDDMEVSDEINACSVEIEVDVNGVKEPWLLMFKIETHNHPT